MPTGAIVTPLSRTPLLALTGGRMSPYTPRVNEHIITPLSYCALGADLAGFSYTAAGSATYPAASRSLACPFVIAAPFLIRKVFWFNGTTVGTDSADCGVYTEAGARVVSGGGTLIAGASGLQEVDVADTQLEPGRYWLAYSQNGVTATPVMLPVTAALARVLGWVQHATYPLPSTLTPSAIASTNVPLMGIASRTLAA